MIDDIFKPTKRSQQFLESKTVETQNTVIKETFSDEELNEKASSLADINDIIDEIRENPENASKPYNRAVFKKLSENNHTEFSKLLKETQKLKENLYNKVLESKKGFVLDISKNAELKEYANNIFGNNKSFISFEDYMTLLELKRTLEIDEIAEVGELEKL